MVGVALLGRVLYIVIRGCYRLPWHYWNGMEMVVMGRWMALGEGFKLGIDYPPSAWTAPCYPLVKALVFRFLGDLIYYLTFPTPRYRHAIEPEMLLLSVFLLTAAVKAITARRQPAGNFSSECAAALPGVRNSITP